MMNFYEMNKQILRYKKHKDVNISDQNTIDKNHFFRKYTGNLRILTVMIIIFKILSMNIVFEDLDTFENSQIPNFHEKMDND